MVTVSASHAGHKSHLVDETKPKEPTDELDDNENDRQRHDSCKGNKLPTQPPVAKRRQSGAVMSQLDESALMSDDNQRHDDRVSRQDGGQTVKWPACRCGCKSAPDLCLGPGCSACNSQHGRPPKPCPWCDAKKSHSIDGPKRVPFGSRDTCSSDNLSSACCVCCCGCPVPASRPISEQNTNDF